MASSRRIPSAFSSLFFTRDGCYIVRRFCLATARTTRRLCSWFAQRAVCRPIRGRLGRDRWAGEVSCRIRPATISRRVRNSINHSDTVIGNKQSAVRSGGDAHWAAINQWALWIGHHPGQKWHRVTGWLAILERDECYLVACAAGAVPRAVFSNKSATVITRWKLFAIVKSKLQGSDMGSEEHVGNDGPGDKIRLLRFDARVDVVSDVAVGPTVKSTVLQAGQIIRRQIVAEFIALVHGGPRSAGHRFDREPNGIAQTGGELARILAIEIANRNRRSHWRLASIDVAAGAHSDQNMFAIGSDCEIARIVAATRQIKKLFRFSHTLRGFWIVLEANQTRHVADVDVVVVKRDSERPR